MNDRLSVTLLIAGLIIMGTGAIAALFSIYAGVILLLVGFVIALFASEVQ